MSSSVFESLQAPGLERARRALVQAAEAESGVQAVLLSGAPGGGMDEAAEVLVRAWLGSECVNLETAVDFQKIVPLGASRMHRVEIIKEKRRKVAADDGDWEDGEDVGSGEEKVGKDDFQGIPILKFFRTRPLMSPTKVVWISEIDRMNSKTANAFLKTLEELPEYARVVMTTGDLGKVLSTIRSRSLVVLCGGLARDGLEPFEAAFADTPGRLEDVRAHEATYRMLYETLEKTKSASPGEAMKIAEELRSAAKKLEDLSGSRARAANSAVMDGIARWLVRERPDRPEAVHAVVEAYRLTIANGNAGLAFDVIATELTL